MKKGFIFLFSALMICAAVGVFVGCADSSSYEPDGQTQKREQFKEKLSHEVTQAEARVKLEKMLSNLKLPSTRGGDTNSLPPITSVYTTGKAAVATRAGEEVEPYFHIFNFGENEGFAIMSGDDRVEPLLALTFKGELTPETEIDNPGFEIAYEKMEDYYVQQVSSRIIEGPSITIPPKDSLPDPIINEEFDTINLPMGPCTVKWGQEAPYNEYCYDQYGYEATAGCAAVALAQFMAIYKYPASYKYFSTSVPEIYNWDDMISNERSPEGTDQIARLIYSLGKPNNLCMIYRRKTNGGSGSEPANVHRTLVNFGYTGGDLIDYDADSVILELANGHPIILRGKTSSGAGHIWLGHGLMKRIRTESHYHLSLGWITFDPFETYYILCNWGWTGDADGYYLSNVFNVATGPTYPDPISPNEDVVNYNFQNNVQAYINIRKTI